MGLISNGTTIFDNGALDSGISLGKFNLISSQTASNSSSISFTSGIDSTYDEYIFYFINVHPVTDDITFHFQANASGATGFNETIQSSTYRNTIGEDESSQALSYLTGTDQANGTNYQLISGSVGSDNDQGISGYLQIYNPASTTYVKHFVSNTSSVAHSNRSNNYYVGGYFNTTNAIDEFDFKFSSGNIDSGQILLYGVD